jgi:NTP pyrophosphatase (non-canonical NTP hydrolase)
MNDNEYKEKALISSRSDFDSAVAPEIASRGLTRLLHGAIGVSGEAGELIDSIKKTAFYGKPIDKENIKEECGDILWYINEVLDSTGLTWDEVKEHNINKLKKRYPEGYTDAAAKDRADKK